MPCNTRNSSVTTMSSKAALRPATEFSCAVLLFGHTLHLLPGSHRHAVAMPQIDEAVELKEELELARAEEAEALRRACNLRSRGASYEDMQAAMREASACHSRTARLHMELRRLSP